MKSLAFVLLFALGAYGGPMGRVLRAIPTNKAQLSYLQSLTENAKLDIDFWTHPSHVGGNVDMRVTTALYPRLAKLLQANGIVFTISIPDVDALISTQNPPARAGRAGFDYGRYNTLDQIYSEMQNLVNRHPRLANLFSVGRSYENREMKAIKISSGSGRKTFFINCGIHAREWVTQATCMYMLNQILSKYGSDASVTAMLDKMDFVIMPVLNVDGYVFTHNGNRMWRKTRSRFNGNCIGADPNRNWNYKWGGIGTSSNPCSDTYPGTKPFSEIEALNVAKYLFKTRKSLIGYMDIHAYSQLWMTSWGYKRDYPPAWTTKVKPAADRAVQALYNAGYRTSYRAGPSSIIIYSTSGGTMDWATGVLGIEYSYGLELRDKGRYGFALPANQIIPTGIETFAAIKAMVAEMKI